MQIATACETSTGRSHVRFPCQILCFWLLADRRRVSTGCATDSPECRYSFSQVVQQLEMQSSVVCNPYPQCMPAINTMRQT